MYKNKTIPATRGEGTHEWGWGGQIPPQSFIFVTVRTFSISTYNNIIHIILTQ